MSTVFLVGITILIAWIAFILSLKIFAVLLRRQTEKAARNALSPERILRIADNASYLGARFPGPNLPPRTRGVLALVETRLFFLPWFPRKAITLPRNAISSVRTCTSFNDKAYNIPVITITVKGVGDPDGVMAWLVHDPEGWEREIREVLGVKE